jgi:hypothetical protein
VKSTTEKCEALLKKTEYQDPLVDERLDLKTKILINNFRRMAFLGSSIPSRILFHRQVKNKSISGCPFF